MRIDGKVAVITGAGRGIGRATALALAERGAQLLLACRDEVGDFGTLLYCGLDWVNPALARRSLELMAEEVMPALNRGIGATGAPAAPDSRADRR